MEQTIQLQAIGHVRAKPAQDFKIGECFVWNYGGVSKIVAVKKETKQQIVFITETPDGKRWDLTKQIQPTAKASADLRRYPAF